MTSLSLRFIRAGGLGAVLFALAAPAYAGPTLSFNLDQISSPAIGTGSVGTVLVSQVSTTVVDIKVTVTPDLFVKTGGPHTPFVFNTTLTGLSVNFVTPASGVAPNGTFSFSALGGSETPYGTFSDAINYSGGNGTANGYSGILEFTVSRAGGISTTDFTGNDGGYFFGADVSNAGNTGGVASRGGTSVAVPEPPATALFGFSILALLGLARHQRESRRARPSR